MDDIILEALRTLRILDESLEFTKTNFIKFIKKLSSHVGNLAELYTNDPDKGFDVIIEWGEKLEKELDIATYGYTSGADILFEYLVNPSWEEVINFAYEGSLTNKSDVNNFIRVYKCDTLDLSKLNNNVAVENLEKCIENILSLNEDDYNTLIKVISKGDNFPLNGGNICGTLKYSAKAREYWGIKLKKGLPIELRLNSDGSARKRVYGFLLDNKNLYLVSAYNKNSGQKDADKDFDNFLVEANDIIDDIENRATIWK